MQKTILMVLAVCLGLSSVAAAQPMPPPPDASPAVAKPSASLLERWADQLANELDHLQEDLYYEKGDYPPTLIRDADEALRAVAHFQEVLRRGSTQEHLVRDFQEMDKQVHQLVNRLSQSGDSWLKRQAARIQYADEQLHYLLRTDPAGGGAGEFQKVLARHAHVLENEAKQLNQLVERLGQGGGRGTELSRAVRDFAGEAEHFHKAVEKGGDREHILNDFRSVNDAWRRAASQVNASPYGVYLRRVAQRTNQVHNQIADLLAQGKPADQRERNVAERPNIEFEIPGIGRFQLR